MARFQVALIVISGLLSLFLPLVTSAQERCGIIEYERLRRLKNPKLPTDIQFEKWMSDKLKAGRLKPFSTQSVTYTIPVVVHVIHNNEALGTGTNVSDAQIHSQIDALNKDFQRLNTDSSNTPAEFLPVAGHVDMQFVLAKQDPDGVATNGITRTYGNRPSWNLSDNAEFKALSYWAAENYLNIWVINLDDYIGYAQLPTSTLVDGLEEGSDDRLTDGVIIDYLAFGVGTGFALAPQFNKGRTATHEIGHFFGLRHIWGDGSNCATDYVDDTPPQPTATGGCPTTPITIFCTNDSHHKMYQNFMDYTDDSCMNLFTVGQVDRLKIIAENSPRRASLLTSPGGSPPMPVANDLGIRKLITPSATQCTNPFIPKIEIRNYGYNNVTSAQVQLVVNGTPAETVNFSFTLAATESTNLSFSSLSFAPLSTTQVSFQILQTNGLPDGKASNNNASVQVKVPASISLPIIEPFNNLPALWKITNQDNSFTWANVVAPDNNSSNRAMFINFYDYKNNKGALDWLITPPFPIGTPSTSQLRFDLSHALHPDESSDELKIYALPGCNTDLSQAILLYEKSGDALKTAPTTPDYFIPNSDAQWRKSELVSLATLPAGSSWQIAFIGKNGYGNNLYIDNVVVSDTEINDVAVTGIVGPGLVQCNNTAPVKFSLKNFSTYTINNFQVQLVLNGGGVITQSFSNTSLLVGEQRIFTLNPVTMAGGVNQFALTVINPNGIADSTPSNNAITFTSHLDQSVDKAPLRLTFDNPQEIAWLAASPGAAKQWEFTSTNKSQSAVYKAFTNPIINQEAWLVSPTLDMSRYQNGSLFFDLSYALRNHIDDRLKLLASFDCGQTYNLILFDRPGSEFNTASSTTEWTPSTDSHWNRQFVSVDTLFGKKNVRLAFVFNNQNGNNLYLDNIELFAGTDVSPPTTSALYQVYYPDQNALYNLALTFNLPTRKDVRLQIYSIMGQVVLDNVFPDTLNQTYYFDFASQSSGIYLFRFQIDGLVTTTKVYVGH